MKEIDKNPLPAILRKHEADILADWIAAQGTLGTRRDQAHEAENRATSKEFLGAMVAAMRDGSTTDTSAANWSHVRELLAEVSARRAMQGYSPAETATFVFSLKQPVFGRLRKELTDAGALGDAFWAATLLIDQLGLYTTEAYQKTREQVISRCRSSARSTAAARRW